MHSGKMDICNGQLSANIHHALHIYRPLKCQLESTLIPFLLLNRIIFHNLISALFSEWVYNGKSVIPEIIILSLVVSDLILDNK